MLINEKVAYLKGLFEGMDLDADAKTTKLISAIIDTLDDMAEEIRYQEEKLDDLDNVVSEIDEDLGDLEDYVADEFDDDDECCCCDDDDMIEVECPSCGEEFEIDIDAIDEDGRIECPNCGELLEFDFEDEDAEGEEEDDD